MKLECKIKREGGTIVDMPNGEGQKPTRVHFKPIGGHDSPHVADVSSKHAARFFKADPEVYVLYEAGPAPKLEPPKDPPPPPPPPTQDPPADPPADQTGGDGDGDGDGDEGGDSMTVAELREAIAAGTLTPEQLRELLELEQQSEKPRQSFVDAIVKALK